MLYHVVTEGQRISAQAVVFRWRRHQRWARNHPAQAAVLSAERILERA